MGVTRGLSAPDLAARRRPRPIPRLRAAVAAIATPLDRYVGGSVFRSFILVAGALTALFSLLAFVEQLAHVGQGRYSLFDAFAYALLTAPSRLVQVATVAMLLGCLLALGTLGRNSELTAMRSLGISEFRILGAVLKLAVPIILALFLIAQFVVPPAQRRAETERSAALSTATTDHGGIWAQGPRQLLSVRGFRGADEADGIDIYAFAADGSLSRIVHAKRAELRPDGTWLLAGVRRKIIAGSTVRSERLASLPWRPFLSSAQIRLLRLPPAAMPPVGLFRYVRHLRRENLPGLRYEQALWRQISLPLSMVAMILASAPFVFAPARNQGVGQKIAIGAVIGVVFSLVRQLSGHLTFLLDLAPAVTALAPPLLLILSAYLYQRANR